MAPFSRPLGTVHQQLRRHRAIVTANKQIIESKVTVFFEEHVDGYPEELYSLVPARVHQ